jgi:exoribonuclease R
MDIIVNLTTGTVVDTTFQNTKICVARNYVYDEPELLTNNTYRNLLGVTNKLHPCSDSHEMVAYWMGQMNIRVAEIMYQRKTGIFRRATFTGTDILPESVKHWKNAVCDYVAYEETDIRHEPLNVDKYLHITSPIRRLVDLLNMTQFQIEMGVPLSHAAQQFYINWSQRIDYINEKMRMIRKVQTQCSLLSLVSSKDSFTCDGYVFDKVITNNQTIVFSVFLKPLNLVYSFKTTNTEIELNQTYSFKIITFQDEEHFKRKVRLQIINK